MKPKASSLIGAAFLALVVAAPALAGTVECERYSCSFNPFTGKVTCIGTNCTIKEK